MQVLEFSGILHAEEKLTSEYGMSDPRYANNYSQLTATFCVRTFNNCLPMMNKVLDKMKSEYFIEKGVCYSNGPDDLFKILSEIITMYKICPYKDVITAMLGLCYK
jgi:hypothetical protein